MHPALLSAYATMLPRLQAEHDLRLSNVLAAGVGLMKKADRQSYIRELVRSANVRPAQPATDAELEAIGIKVRRG